MEEDQGTDDVTLNQLTFNHQELEEKIKNGGEELEKYLKLMEQDQELLALKSRIKTAYETKYE